MIIRNDLELKILTPIELRKKMISKSNYECLNKYIDFIMPYHFYNIPESNIFQIVYDFSIHFCPELKGSNKSFEKSILKSLNSKRTCILMY